MAGLDISTNQSWCSWVVLRRIILSGAILSIFIYMTYPHSASVVKVSDNGRRTTFTFKTRERRCVNFALGGYTFRESGRNAAINSSMVTCLIHSLSPYLEQEASKRFLDPARSNIYYANSPAMVWLQDKLIVVSRIWLDREVYESGLTVQWPENDFADNWLFMQSFDEFMRPKSDGQVLGIPSPKQFNVGDGPIEPRLFVYEEKAYVTFNAAMSFNRGTFFDYTVIWDIERNLPIIPEIQGGSPMLNTSMDIHRDKHWMPYVDRGRLMFVYNLDPLMVMECTIAGKCWFVHREDDAIVFHNSFSHLRGGTPFQEWKWPYFVGVAHTTLHKRSTMHRSYTAHIVIICVDPYHVVYVSNDLRVHPSIFFRAPMVRAKYIDEGFIFPVSLILESDDSAAIGVHVNDHSSVILRLKGLSGLVQAAISADQEAKPSRGPPVGFIQEHLHDVMEDITHVQFDHKTIN